MYEPELYIDQEITEQLDLINAQEDLLFSKTDDDLFIGIAGKPDFQLVVPEALTEKVYLQIIRKMFAQIRFEVYVKIRHEIRENNKKELSKRELKTILKALDLWKIRNQVFDLYNLSELNEPTHRTLIKAHIKFLC